MNYRFCEGCLVRSKPSRGKKGPNGCVCSSEAGAFGGTSSLTISASILLEAARGTIAEGCGSTSRRTDELHELTLESIDVENDK